MTLDLSNPSGDPRRFIRRRRLRRRGFTVIMVLGLISVTLAISYALMRSQATALQIQVNSQRRNSAREAALTGIAAGMRKMSDLSWGGVNSSFSGDLSDSESYQVSYTAGDAALVAGHPDLADHPYRVTVISTGYASASGSSAATSYQIQTVVRLTPRQLSDVPPDWPLFLQHTLYQLRDDAFWMELPSRIEGTLRLQGALHLGEAYNWNSPTRVRFLTDLNAMRLAGLGDYRPFNATISLPFGDTSSNTRGLLTTNLGLAISNIAKANPSSQWVYPTSLTSYQIYPGGPTYAAAQAAGTLENVTLASDPITNPLGIFYRLGDVTVKDNVTVRGMLVTSGSVVIRGANVRFEPAPVAPLDGTSNPIQLPVIVAADDVRVESTGTGTISGMMTIWDELDIQTRSQSLPLAITGRVVARGYSFGKKTQWDGSSFLWNLLYSLFNNQLTGSTTSVIPYFPTWLGLVGYDHVPQVTIKPEMTPVTYHWLKPGNPVFVAGSGDNGLRWDLVDWVDSP